MGKMEVLSSRKVPIGSGTFHERPCTFVSNMQNLNIVLQFPSFTLCSMSCNKKLNDSCQTLSGSGIKTIYMRRILIVAFCYNTTFVFLLYIFGIGCFCLYCVRHFRCLEYTAYCGHYILLLCAIIMDCYCPG